MINAKNIGDGEVIEYSLDCISKAAYDRLPKYKLEKGDILFGRSGTIDRHTYINDNFAGAFQGTNAIRLRLHDNRYAKFVSYYLNLKSIKKQVLLSAGKTTQQYLTPDNLSQIIIHLPDLVESEKIADLLTYLDSKIIINNSINAELEKLAKTIYNYWFVQFDFPDKNGKPYKSSGGEMVYNDTLKRDIPKGWSLGYLNKLLKFEKGTEVGSASYYDKKENDSFVYFYRVADIDGNCSTYVDKLQNTLVFTKPENIVVTFDGSVGKIGFGLDGAISGGLQKIYDPDYNINNAMVWQIFNDDYIQKTIHKYSTGSILLHASSSIEHLVIPYDEKMFKIFQDKIAPFYSRILVNKKQNAELSALRDFLLPLLMNGQVKVGEA